MLPILQLQLKTFRIGELNYKIPEILPQILGTATNTKNRNILNITSDFFNYRTVLFDILIESELY